MDPEVRAFGERLANTAIAQEWLGVHSLLAPWLRAGKSVSDTRAFFEDDYADAWSLTDVPGQHYPETIYVSGNDSSLADLRGYILDIPRASPIPLEITPANFRQWMKLQLQCSDHQADLLGFDYFTEIWLIVVATDEGLRVGYWSHDPYESAPI